MLEAVSLAALLLPLIPAPTLPLPTTAAAKFLSVHCFVRRSALSKLLQSDQTLVGAGRVTTHLIYVEYILIKAAWDTKTCATLMAARVDAWPSASSDDSSVMYAFSSDGRNDSLWNESKLSKPLNTILRSVAGTTVSFVETFPMPVTGAVAGVT